MSRLAEKHILATPGTQGVRVQYNNIPRPTEAPHDKPDVPTNWETAGASPPHSPYNCYHKTVIEIVKKT